MDFRFARPAQHGEVAADIVVEEGFMMEGGGAGNQEQMSFFRAAQLMKAESGMDEKGSLSWIGGTTLQAGLDRFSPLVTVHLEGQAAIYSDRMLRPLPGNGFDFFFG